MPVIIESEFPEIVTRAEERGRTAVGDTADHIAVGGRLNLSLHGSIDSGELFDSLHAGEEDDDGYVGFVSAGEGLPDARAVYIELGTGVRGSQYEFPGKPHGVTYDMNWERGIPKDTGFAYLIPALEAEREPFEERMGDVYG